MPSFKILMFCLLISISFIYALRIKGKNSFMIPGDVFIEKHGLKVYIPLGSALVMSIIMYIIIKSFM